MEKSKNKIENIVFAALILFFSVGAAGHLTITFREFMLGFTKYFLLIASALLSYLLLFQSIDKELFFRFIVIYLFTFAAEFLGVQTGLIFGNYQYGNVLGIKIFGVPPIIGLNWVFVVLGAYQLVQKILKKRIAIITLASILSVAFDFILEPVAIKLEYWSWTEGKIPNYNYISWFIVSFISVLFFTKTELNIKTDILDKFFIIQLVFFVILNLGLTWV